ncbi:hypothetical protein PENSPDRAFT_682908 [Peniophora sp. CONT]|nr:hypothetical protein PENSPDRAFT_682908 [Peniophora sp. CONT]
MSPTGNTILLKPTTSKGVVGIPRPCVPPQAIINNYPVRRKVADKPSAPVEARVETIHVPAPSPLAENKHNPADILDLITLAGTVCMFSTSTALTGNMTPSIFVDACALSGIIGTLFVGVAASLVRNRACKIAMRFLLLSGGCAMTSAMCLVGGTQTRVATMLTGACMAAMLVVVLRYAVDRKKVTDAEAAMYPPTYR